MSATSLRRRLIVILLGLTLFSWFISVVVTAINAHYLIRAQIDQQLVEYMDMSQFTMNLILEDENTSRYFEERNPILSASENLIRIPGYGNPGQIQRVNLWYGKKQVVVGESTPEFPRPESEGFHNTEITQSGEAQSWRILYRFESRNNVWLAIGLNMGEVQSITSTTLNRLTLPLALILPVTIGVLLVGIKRGLLPLDRLATDIAARKADDLEPVHAVGVPRELSPLVNALNSLLGQIQIMLASEQRFTANAAHELQTPLTAIKAEVQRCQREVDSDSAREMLERISTRVTRATNTVRQLLTLARLDPDQDIAFQSLDLEQLLLEVVAEYGGLAVDRELEFDIRGPTNPALVEGNLDWLIILFRNLVANALNYASVPGTIEVRIVATEEQVTVSIANDCPPIANEAMAQLTQRFYRVPNTSRPGSGLGLSIAQRIVELHNGALRLSHRGEGRGFRAEVVFAKAAHRVPDRQRVITTLHTDPSADPN